MNDQINPDERFDADHFHVSVELGNTAMQTPADLAAALESVAGKLQGGLTAGSVRDGNGNGVGSFGVPPTPAVAVVTNGSGDRGQDAVVFPGHFGRDGRFRDIDGGPGGETLIQHLRNRLNGPHPWSPDTATVMIQSFTGGATPPLLVTDELANAPDLADLLPRDPATAA